MAGRLRRPTSLRAQQCEMIRSMLRPRGSEGDVEELGLPHEPEWKVLVYDKYGENILSPLLSVSELRELGVTLYLQLNAEREHIPDTTVVYFVLPTRKNVDRICKDLQEDLYDKCQLNFLSAVPTDLLEQLAMTTVSSQTACEVERVYDMYTNFISLEDDLFVIREQEREKISYLALNSPSDDAEMGAAVDDIVTSLFCALVSNGQVPIIRASRGHAAEMIAGKLDKKLRDHLKLSRTQLFREGMSATGSFQRPLLVLVDRHVDIPTMLHHTCTYQALTHDVLDYKLNRVAYMVESGGEGQPVTHERKVFEMDSRSDPFWRANRGLPFPSVAEAVEQELASCKKREAQIRSAGSSGDGGGDPNLEDNTSRIKDAVSSLPQLLEQKRQLTGHMSLLMAVMDKIKEGKLDSFYSLEEEILNSTTPTESLYEVVKGGGSEADKLRLLIIAMLGKGVKPEEIARAEAALKEAGCDMDAVAHAHALNKQRVQRSARVGGSSGAKDWSFDLLSSHSSKLFGEGLIKRLLPTSTSGVVTQIVEALMEFKPTDLTKDYVYFDPKQVRTGGSSKLEVPKSRAPVDECIVFMVGGGNYCEYQNLMDSAAARKKIVTYGCTDLVTPDEFLQQLADVQKALGGEGHAKGKK